MFGGFSVFGSQEWWLLGSGFKDIGAWSGLQVWDLRVQGSWNGLQV